MKRKSVFFTIGIFTALLMLVTGCTSGPASSVDKTSTTAGRLIVNITDAPSAPEIEEVWLTVTGLQVHMAGSEDAEEQEQEQEENSQETQNEENNENQNENNGGWISLPLVDDGGNPDEVRFNLLKFWDGSQAKLAVGDLDPGRYTQLRMDVKLVELKVKDVTGLQEAKLPSNVLKFVHPFEIVDDGDTELLFDFDALKSVNETGNGKYMFKPVIKLTTTKQPQANMAITTPSLPNGEAGVIYTSTTLSATGGNGSYTWSLDTGSALPAGLVLTSAGLISGTPDVAITPGIYTFTIKVVDGSPSPKSITKPFSIEIAASGILQIITTSLPDGAKDVPYPDTNLAVVGGTGPYTWEVTSATGFPAGLTFTNGLINGTPTEKGDYSFTVKVTDSAVNTDTQVITISIK